LGKEVKEGRVGREALVEDQGAGKSHVDGAYEWNKKCRRGVYGEIG
jgi:hypothetical protein